MPSVTFVSRTARGIPLAAMSAMGGLSPMTPVIPMSFMVRMVQGIRFVTGISRGNVVPTTVFLVSPILPMRLMALVVCGDVVFHGPSIAFWNVKGSRWQPIVTQRCRLMPKLRPGLHQQTSDMADATSHVPSSLLWPEPESTGSSRPNLTHQAGGRPSVENGIESGPSPEAASKSNSKCGSGRPQ